MANEPSTLGWQLYCHPFPGAAVQLPHQRGSLTVQSSIAGIFRLKAGLRTLQPVAGCEVFGHSQRRGIAVGM